MSNTERYYGNTHMFTSLDSGSVITLKAGVGETLSIPDITSGTITTDYVKAKEVYWEELTEDLGLSQLSNTQIIPVYNSAIYREQGTSIAISDYTLARSTIIYGGPYDYWDGFAGTGGGSILYESVSYGPYAYESDFYITQNCSDTGCRGGEYTDVSEDGTLASSSSRYFVGSSGITRINLFTYNGTSWIAGSNIPGYDKCKNTNNYVLVAEPGGELSVFHPATSVLVPQQTILASGTEILIFDILTDDTLYYALDTSMYKYTRSGTVWTLVNTNNTGYTITHFGVSGTMSIFSSSTNVYILVNDVQVATFTYSGITAVCTNGVCCFWCNSTTIYTASDITGTWAVSVNTKARNNVDYMACNEKTLAVGRTIAIAGIGEAHTYDIDNTFYNHLITTNNLLLDNEVDQNLALTADYGTITLTSATGVDIVGPTSVTGATTITGAVGITGATLMTGNLDVDGTLNVSSKIQTGNGSLALGGFNFINSTGSGMHYTSTDLSVNSNAQQILYTLSGSTYAQTASGSVILKSGAVNSLTASSTTLTTELPIRAGLGSSTVPSYSFTSYPTSGLWHNANGVQLSNLGSIIVFTDSGLNSYFQSPATVIINSDSDGSTAGDIHLRKNSVNKLVIDTNYITASVPYVFPIGSVSAPGIQTANNSSTGFYSTGAGRIDTAIAGVKAMTVGGEANSRALVSMGNGASAISSNATWGSILRTWNDHVGQWGWESTCGNGVNVHAMFMWEDGGGTLNQLGSISTNGATTFYNTTSDKRLKKDIVNIINNESLNILKSIEPKKFKWKSTDKDDFGFIAQDVKLILPDIVTGNETKMNGDKIEPLMMDYSKLVPHLVSAVKSLDAKITAQDTLISTLIARLEALETINV